jgi:hypothetical protein
LPRGSRRSILVTAAAFQARNLLLSLRAGEPYRVVRALALEAISCALEGTRRQQRVTALLAAGAADRDEDAGAHALGMVALADGIAALSCGRWQEGEAALSSAETTFRTGCVGVIWELATLHHFRVWTFAFRGAYAEMMSYGHRVLDESRQRNDLYTPATIGMFVERSSGCSPTIRTARGMPSRRWRGAGHIRASACSG